MVSPAAQSDAVVEYAEPPKARTPDEELAVSMLSEETVVAEEEFTSTRSIAGLPPICVSSLTKTGCGSRPDSRLRPA